MKQGTMIHSGTIDEIAERTSPSKTIHIDLTDPFDELDACMADFSMVSSLSSIDDSMTRFELTHTGTTNDEAEILASLVNKGAKVCRFQPKQSKVEDLFLQVESDDGKGEKGMNPLILRGIRERLRGKHLIAAGLFSLIVTSTVYFRAYLDEAGGGWQGEPSPVRGARYAFPFLLALQGFYLMFLGTGRVASITAEEKESGTDGLPANDPNESVFQDLGLPLRPTRKGVLHVRPHPAFSPPLHDRGRAFDRQCSAPLLRLLFFRYSLPFDRPRHRVGRAQTPGRLLGLPRRRARSLHLPSPLWPSGNFLSFLPDHSSHLFRKDASRASSPWKTPTMTITAGRMT